MKFMTIRAPLSSTCIPHAPIPGPLLLLRGFEPSMIKFCAMHVVNLGLVLTANGGALTFGCMLLTLYVKPTLEVATVGFQMFGCAGWLW